MSTFYTISSSSQGIYKEKGSKFLAFAYPVSSEIEVKSALENLKKEYFDARHHCYAWVLGMENQVWRANDDGEPAHSAGDPILGQIRSFELTNVLAVVVRYFGGTKLGVGGLIQAYKVATEDALKKASKIEIFETVKISMKFPYAMMSVAERLVTDFDIDVLVRNFQLSCEIEGMMKKELLGSFLEKTADMYTMAIEVV